jgi:predicted molibdopterin-dependent oxidoreductase YjgC
MGTNNIDYSTNTQPEKLLGLQDTLGYPAGTNSIWDLEKSGCILVINSNTTEEHNVVAVPIKQAVKQGSHLIVIDPREVELTRYATLWLRPRPGSELMLLGGLMRAIVDEVAEDTDYLREQVENIDLPKRALARYFDLERTAEVTGVSKELIRDAASLFAKTNPAAIVYALDTIASEQTLDMTHAIVNLALITGNIGKEGGGVYPLLHGANAQGAWDVGSLPSLLPGYRRVSDDVLRYALEQVWDTALPQDEGIGVRDISNAVSDGQVKTMLVFGEDSLPSDKIFERLDFLVVHANFLDGVAQQADVVLPASTFAETTGTYTNLERRIQAVSPALESHEGYDRTAMSVICDLARLMNEKGFNFNSPENVFEEITRVIPTYTGCTYASLVGKMQLQPTIAPGHPIPQQFYPTTSGLSGTGPQWPLLDGFGTPVLYSDGFPYGKAKLIELTQPTSVGLSNPEFPMLLAWGRVLHQPGRELSIERNGVNRIKREEIVDIHPEDADLLGLSSGDNVSLTTFDGEVINGVVTLTEDLHRGLISLTTLFGDLATQLQTSKEHNAMAKVPTLPLRPVRVDKLI